RFIIGSRLCSSNWPRLPCRSGGIGRLWEQGWSWLTVTRTRRSRSTSGRSRRGKTTSTAGCCSTVASTDTREFQRKLWPHPCWRRVDRPAQRSRNRWRLQLGGILDTAQDHGGGAELRPMHLLISLARFRVTSSWRDTSGQTGTTDRITSPCAVESRQH